MKQRKSKKIVETLVFTGMAAVLTACTAGIQENVMRTEGTDAQTAVVRWYSDEPGWGPESWETAEKSPLMDAVLERYGAVFDIEQPLADAAAKLELMLRTDELPDLLSLTDETLIYEVAASGKVWDMESFLMEYDPTSHLLTDFPQDIRDVLCDRYGGWYAIPSDMHSADNRELYPPCDAAYDELSAKLNDHVILFNTKIMKALGITQEDVRTQAGFYEACEKVKNAQFQADGQTLYPVMLHGSKWIDESLDGILAGNFGAVLADTDGVCGHGELAGEYRDALQFINDCINRGYLDGRTLMFDEKAILSCLYNGSIFCWIGNCAQLKELQNLPYASFGPILAESGAEPVLSVNLSAGMGRMQTFVAKDCENPQLIARLLSFMTSREGMLLNEYGVEGTDYIMDENGICKRTNEGSYRYRKVYGSNMRLWPFANTDFTRSIENPLRGNTHEAAYYQIATAFGSYEGTDIIDIRDIQDSGVRPQYAKAAVNAAVTGEAAEYLRNQKAKIVFAKTKEEFDSAWTELAEKLCE